MSNKRHKPEEIVTKLRQVEVLVGQGMARIDAIREIGVVEQTYYRWRKLYGGMGRDQVKELKRLQKENERLRRAISAKIIPILQCSGVTVHEHDERLSRFEFRVTDDVDCEASISGLNAAFHVVSTGTDCVRRGPASGSGAGDQSDGGKYHQDHSEGVHGCFSNRPPLRAAIVMVEMCVYCL